MPAPAPHFKKKKLHRKSEKAGCLTVILGGVLSGVLYFVLPLLGIIVGAGLLILGLALLFKEAWVCQHCGNEIAKTCKICPVCKATYEK